MTSVAGFAHVNHYRDLSFLQAFRLGSVTDELLVSSVQSANINTVKAVVTWKWVVNRLSRVHTTGSSLYGSLVDVITFQFLKKILVKKYLRPDVIRKIDALSKEMRRRVKLPIHPSDCSKNSDKIYKAYEYFKEYREWLCEQVLDEVDFKNYYMRFTSARYFDVLTQDTRDRVAREVDEYFRKKTTLTSFSNHKTLPTWYHATKKEQAKKILESCILATKKGVCFSSVDEYRSYGSYTFVFDDRITKAFQVEYISDKKAKERWICIKQNISIKKNTILDHIAVSNLEEKNELYNFLENSKRDVSCIVMTRDASLAVDKIFKVSL